MFPDKVAIVTGSGRGIGLAAAKLLAAGGAHVVVADLDDDVVARATAEIEGSVDGWAGNLTAKGAPQALVDHAIEHFGQLDIVVNNAGYTLDGAVHKMSDEAFQAMIDIHTVVPFRILRAAAPHLREPAKQEAAERREVCRKVVNVTSVAAYGNAGQANYSAAKAGLIGLTKTLAREWGRFKINVNAVAFGFMETRLTAPKTDGSVIDIDGHDVHVGVPAELLTSLNDTIPFGRPGSVHEAAGGIAFLCSPWSDYVTGQVLNVSGGVPIGMTA